MNREYQDWNPNASYVQRQEEDENPPSWEPDEEGICVQCGVETDVDSGLCIECWEACA